MRRTIWVVVFVAGCRLRETAIAGASPWSGSTAYARRVELAFLLPAERPLRVTLGHFAGCLKVFSTQAKARIQGLTAILAKRTLFRHAVSGQQTEHAASRATEGPSNESM